jgi:hypothetical protein
MSYLFTLPNSEREECRGPFEIGYKGPNPDPKFADQVYIEP